jgi:adiponectin receptor
VLLIPLQCGAVIYACRIPERWYPGKFDIAGHSHQLWHAAVVLAAWVHYLAIMVLLQWRDASGGCAAGGTGVHGPVHEVLGQMQQAGQAPLAIEQLPDFVQQYVARRGL